MTEQGSVKRCAIRLNSAATAGCLLLLVVICGCASPKSPFAAQINQGRASGAGDFNLAVLDGSLYEQAQFSLAVDKRGDTAVVIVAVEEIRNLKAVYLELAFDAARYRPISVDSLGLLEQAGTPLVLSLTNAPGLVHYGEVLANWPDKPGFSGAGAIAEFRFETGPDADYARIDRRSSAVPASDQASHSLIYNAITGVFRWYYVNPGDYDQNGLVSVADLTPVGANFNAMGPFDAKSALFVVDGDHNGLIGISDITPIGANFNNNIDSFAVYGSTEGGDYPASNSAMNGAGAVLIGTQHFASSKGGGAERKYWDLVMVEPLISGHFWQRPVARGEEGTPSQLLSHVQEWHLAQIYDYLPQGDAVDIYGMSMATINERPAILLIETNTMNFSVNFQYLAGADVVGSQWNMPVSALGEMGHHSSPSLAEIGHRPAFIWWDDELVSGLRYMRAANADGTAWSAPITIDDAMDPGIGNKLLEYEGNPAAIYSNGATQFHVSVASDPAGTSWHREFIYSSANLDRFDAQPLPGGIGVALDDDDTGALVYKFVTINGFDIAISDDALVYPPNTGQNYFIDLGISGDTPYLVTLRSGSNRLHYSFAHDETGQSWTAPALIGAPDKIGGRAGVAANGLPWICYQDGDTGYLHSYHAVEPRSNQWINETDVADTAQTIGWLRMSRAGIHPAVTWIDDVAKLVYYAVFY